MTFTPLTPPTRSKGVAQVTASVIVFKHAGAQIRLGLGSAFLAQFPGSAALFISAGEGEDAGKLMLQFDKKGPFKLGLLHNGGAMLHVPVSSGAPSTARLNEGCTIEKRGTDSCIIVLPIEAWAAQGGRPAKPAPAAAPAAKPASPPPPPAGEGRPTTDGLDMAAYLQRKGLKVERTSNGFLIGGIAKTTDQALRIVNTIARRAGWRR